LSDDKVIIVSADGHAVMPSDQWTHYLDEEFHDELASLGKEGEVMSDTMALLNDMAMPEALDDVFDKEGLYRSGQWRGLFDPEVRLRELDREGVACEFIFHGDFRFPEMGFSPMNATHSFGFVDAGVRAYDRWAADTFGPLQDRFLLVAPTGTNRDLDATVRELHWVADHGFVGAFVPGFTRFEGLPPLYEAYWEPVWQAHDERDLALVVHGGYGFGQGYVYDAIEQAHATVAAQNGGTMELIIALTQGLFNDSFFRDLGCRRALWQLFMSGIFDRHPNLKLFMTEVRADWIPPALRHLDALFDEHRADLPATRKPSEYWEENCMAGLSFMHTAEIEMRDEIGVHKILFGRDYPHTEGTWPNTGDYLRTLFTGVPERDIRMILGENAVDFLGLDRAKLAAIAERVGPSIDEITGGPEIDPALLAHLAERTGILREREGEARVQEYASLLEEDLAGVAVTVAG
jgi:predicted TIM-barrel fold metal-dependent hydrolase